MKQFFCRLTMFCLFPKRIREVGCYVVRSTRRRNKGAERRKTTLRFRTQRSECRRNVDEGLLVTRECVSLEVMPAFQSAASCL